VGGTIVDRLRLAAIPAETPLKGVLAMLLPGTRAAVITGDGAPRLVTAGDILAACNRASDDENLAGVKVGTVFHTHSPMRVPKPAVKYVSIASSAGRVPEFVPANISLLGQATIVGGLGTEERLYFESVFEGDDHRYAIQHVDGNVAVVVTASERFAADLGESVVICSCIGPTVHSFEKRDLVIPGKCNMLHGVAVNCSDDPL
jgi:hypothetical protein